MIDFLLGVPGKLKTISDYLAAYLSPTRCAKIDNLDTTLTSRAPASTALSTATWTAPRAGKLDLIETDPCSKPPILNGIIAQTSGSTYSPDYVAILSHTGSGVLNMVRATSDNPTYASPYVQITIDGVVVLDSLAQTDVGGYVVGTGDVDKFYGMDQIPFRTSLVVAIRTSNGSYRAYGYVRYRKTS